MSTEDPFKNFTHVVADTAGLDLEKVDLIFNETIASLKKDKMDACVDVLLSLNSEQRKEIDDVLNRGGNSWSLFNLVDADYLEKSVEALTIFKNTEDKAERKKIAEGLVRMLS